MGFLSSIHTSKRVQFLHTEFCHYTKESRGHVQISAVMGTNFMDVVEYVTSIFFWCSFVLWEQGTNKDDWRVGQKIGLFEGSCGHQKVYHGVGLYEPRWSYVTGCLARTSKRNRPPPVMTMHDRDGPGCSQREVSGHTLQFQSAKHHIWNKGHQRHRKSIRT